MSHFTGGLQHLLRSILLVFLVHTYFPPPVPGSGGVDGDSGPHFGCSCIFTPFHRLKGYSSLKTGQRKFPYYFSRDRGSEGIFMQPCFTSTFQGRTQQFLMLVFDIPNKQNHRRLLQSVVFNVIRSIIHIYSMTIYFSMSIFSDKAFLITNTFIN